MPCCRHDRDDPECNSAEFRFVAAVEHRDFQTVRTAPRARLLRIRVEVGLRHRFLGRSATLSSAAPSVCEPLAAASDESSTDFINNLVNQLPQDDNAPISSSEFVLAFARCLAYAEGDEVAEVLERRASEYRRIGKLLGMVKQETIVTY